MTTEPLMSALETRAPDHVAALSSLLESVLKADLGTLRLEQTAGERFTGGRSTPIWKLYFKATRGAKTRDTQLVAKWVKPTTDFRRSSYANERQFYSNVASVVRKAGCRIPHLLHSEVSSRGMCFLFDDLSVDFPLHPECLEVPAAQAALRWLANFHACFWEADAAGAGFPAGMSPTSDYWGIARGDNEERLENVAGALVASSKVLKTHGVWDVAKTLGQRLAAAARPLDAALRKTKGFVKYRTVLHGDFKAANFFLREKDTGFEAAVVDFEFSGPGLVAADLANFLFPDLRMSLLEEEPGLLRFYHEALVAYLDDLGVATDFSFDMLELRYAVARCDYMRYMLGKGWTACSSADARLLDAVHTDLGRFDKGQVLTHQEYATVLAECF